MNTKRPTNFLLAALFFLQWGAPGLWNVCFSNVLRAYGLDSFIPYAFACHGLAAFISPLVVGAIADQQLSPILLLRWLNVTAGVFLALCFASVQFGWGGWTMLGFMMAHALAAAPLFSLSTSIILSNLDNPAKNFGRLRLWATVGWIVAGWTVSWVLMADASPVSGYASALAMGGISLFTYLLPPTPPPSLSCKLSWKQRLGLDALSLLTHRDHRIVFLTTALLTIPLAAFFPFTPLHLRELGFKATTATMAIGQMTEILCLLALAGLWTRFRLKWIFLIGIFAAVLRFSFFGLDSPATMVLGISMHGICYALFFVTGQVYVAERIDKEWQTRAQALLSLLTGGVGNLLGYLGTGWWKNACTDGSITHWPRFWWGLNLSVALVAVFFIVFYHGLGKRPGVKG